MVYVCRQKLHPPAHSQAWPDPQQLKVYVPFSHHLLPLWMLLKWDNRGDDLICKMCIGENRYLHIRMQQNKKHFKHLHPFLPYARFPGIGRREERKYIKKNVGLSRQSLILDNKCTVLLLLLLLWPKLHRGDLGQKHNLRGRGSSCTLPMWSVDNILKYMKYIHNSFVK